MCKKRNTEKIKNLENLSDFYRIASVLVPLMRKNYDDWDVDYTDDGFIGAIIIVGKDGVNQSKVLNRLNN